MAGFPRWTYTKILAWAEIGGVTTEVVGLQLAWELNGLPVGTLHLPVGIAQDATVAAIHGLVRDLTVQTPVTVWAELGARDGSDGGLDDLGLPAGRPFVLFQGLTAGGGYSRGAGAARYTIALNHALVRLGQGSAFSDSSHPGNPAAYAYGALMPGGQDTGALDWTVLTQANTHVQEATLRQDLWGKAFYPWFQALTARDGFQIRERNVQGEPTNRQAAAALALLDPAGRGGVPAVFRPEVALDAHVADLIAKDLALATSDPAFAANQTLWDILIGAVAPDYLLAVVPTARTGLVVPFVPCSRAIEPIAIGSDGTTQLDYQMATPRPLRALGILSGIACRTGLTDPAPGAQDLGVGGWYDVRGDGYVRIDRGPRWMAGVQSASLYAAESAGGNLQPIATAHSPGTGTTTGAAAAARARAKQSIKPLLDAYAQARFAQEVLKGRFGVVSGPFRADVVPGALVQIEGAGEALLADADQLGLPYLGEVLRVTVQLDAQSRTAGTALHVGYLRTVREHTDPKLTVPGHPLYTRTFDARGRSLLD